MQLGHAIVLYFYDLFSIVIFMRIVFVCSCFLHRFPRQQMLLRRYTHPILAFLFGFSDNFFLFGGGLGAWVRIPLQSPDRLHVRLPLILYIDK